MELDPPVRHYVVDRLLGSHRAGLRPMARVLQGESERYSVRALRNRGDCFDARSVYCTDESESSAPETQSALPVSAVLAAKIRSCAAPRLPPRVGRLNIRPRSPAYGKIHSSAYTSWNLISLKANSVPLGITPYQFSFGAGASARLTIRSIFPPGTPTRNHAFSC